jgi:hypothetical protein
MNDDLSDSDSDGSVDSNRDRIYARIMEQERRTADMNRVQETSAGYERMFESFCTSLQLRDPAVTDVSIPRYFYSSNRS